MKRADRPISNTSKEQPALRMPAIKIKSKQLKPAPLNFENKDINVSSQIHQVQREANQTTSLDAYGLKSLNKMSAPTKQNKQHRNESQCKGSTTNNITFGNSHALLRYPSRRSAAYHACTHACSTYSLFFFCDLKHSHECHRFALAKSVISAEPIGCVAIRNNTQPTSGRRGATTPRTLPDTRD